MAKAGALSEKLDLKPVFDALTAPNSIFMTKYWQRQPCYTSEVIPSLQGCWTMEDMEKAVAKEFLCTYIQSVYIHMHTPLYTYLGEGGFKKTNED